MSTDHTDANLLLSAVLDDDVEYARRKLARLTPEERGRLADASHRLHDLCTQAAGAGVAPAFAQPEGPGRIGLFVGPSKPFTAQYDGVCPSCLDQITGDFDMIVMTDEGAVHVDCAS